MKIPRKIDELLEDPEIGKERPDAIALLILYRKHSSARKQMYLSPIKVDDASELLDISVHRIRKAKKVLRRKGYITDYSEQNPLRQVEHFIRLLDSTH